MIQHFKEVLAAYRAAGVAIVHALKAPFIRLRAFWVRMRLSFFFKKVQDARVVPDGNYFVAPDGSVRRKYPRAHVTKKLRRVFRTPDQIRKYINDSQAALDYAKGEVERKDAALRDIHSTIITGNGSFSVLMAKLKEAIG